MRMMRAGRSSEGTLAARRLFRRVLVAVCCAIALFLLALSPIGSATGLLPTASAHALLVRSDPAENAILNAPPAQVKMWATFPDFPRPRSPAMPAE